MVVCTSHPFHKELKLNSDLVNSVILLFNQILYIFGRILTLSMFFNIYLEH